MLEPKRRALPKKLKLAILARQNDRCADCGAELFTSEKTKPIFDHRPPLQLRAVNDTGTDWVPAQHDIEWLAAICADPCNKLKTFGRSKATTRGGDITEIARSKRIRKRIAASAEAQKDRAQFLIDRRFKKLNRARKSWPKRKMQGRQFQFTKAKKRAPALNQ